jgi:hypothetical protein
MSSIVVKLEDKPVVRWTGNEQELANAMAEFERTAASVGKSPDELAAIAVGTAMKSGSLPSGLLAVRAAAGGILYYIVKQGTQDTENSGTFRDYISARDFVFNLSGPTASGNEMAVKIHVEASFSAASWASRVTSMRIRLIYAT